LSRPETHRSLRAPTQLAGAFAALLLAGSLYLLFRPTSLLLFHWIHEIGFLDVVVSLRSAIPDAIPTLPRWLLYSVPFSLYVLSYGLFMRWVWEGSDSPGRHVWIWLLPLCAFGSELLQWPNAIPGTFDGADLVALGATLVLLVSMEPRQSQLERG
jgi:hypothetical protein